MRTQVTLSIPNELYQRAKRIAQSSQRGVNEVLAESIVLVDNQVEVPDFSEPDEALEREKAAYIAMHPTLREKYPGQHVAIHNERLVDHDTDLDALWERIDARYPDEFVWVATVKEEPIETLRNPSFWFVGDE